MKKEKLTMFKSKESEEKVNTDRYLITYADLITLLLGLFVILYASSQVDEGKYKEFSSAFAQYFNAKKKAVTPGGKGVLAGEREMVPDPIAQSFGKKPLEEISREIQKSLHGMIEKGMITVRNTNTGILLTLPEKLLFESARAEVQPEGDIVLDSLAKVLQGLHYQVTIDGHTDSAPIRTFRYESNWHLSVARSLSVAYNLILKGVPEKNFIIRGFGAQRPIAENLTPDGRAMNRRVEISISELPSEVASTKGYADYDTTKKDTINK